MSDEIQVRVNAWGKGHCLALVWKDPITGKTKAQTAGTANRKEAERAAALLQKELNSGKYLPPSKLKWSDFRTRYATERLAVLSQGTRDSAASALNHLERVLNPDRLAKVNTATMSTFIAKLRADKMKESTLACHLRHIKAALRWAVKMRLMVEAPAFDMPRAGESKGRPILLEEFERMQATTLKVRPQDAAAWERLLTGLWLSGLRLGEAVILSWEPDAPFAVDLGGKFPAFRIEARAQKARRDERLPMTPDFAEWLLQTPEGKRIGRVFPLPSLLDGQPLTLGRVGRLVSKIGEKAHVVVAKDADTGEVKYATAHDLRRSFGTRWAKRVMPAVLQRLMRHRSIGTTMKYYVGIEADDVAADLWAQHRPDAPSAKDRAKGCPESAENAEGAPDAATSETPYSETPSVSGGQGIRALNRLPGT